MHEGSCRPKACSAARLSNPVACPWAQLDLGNYAWALGKGYAELAARASPASDEDRETTIARYVSENPVRLKARALPYYLYTSPSWRCPWMKTPSFCELSAAGCEECG